MELGQRKMVQDFNAWVNECPENSTERQRMNSMFQCCYKLLLENNELKRKNEALKSTVTDRQQEIKNLEKELREHGDYIRMLQAQLEAYGDDLK